MFKSLFDKDGQHYNIFHTKEHTGMDDLRGMFQDGIANELNFCLFSTSGVHGTYATIEDAEKIIVRGNKDEDGIPETPTVTFLIVHPRIVCLRYGNCTPKTKDDIAFLKALRKSSIEAVQKIGFDMS